MCRPGSLIGFALIAQRSGPNRQSQASKTNAKQQKTPSAAAKQMGRDKLPFPPPCFFFFFAFQLPVSRFAPTKRKEKVINGEAAPEQLEQNLL